jgi:hypothetical protein
MLFKKKKDENKREKVIDILKRAARAWDVDPKGTMELKLIERLADEILNL